MAFFDLGSALGAAMAPRRRPLWGGARSIFEDPEDQPLMTDKRNPELYDLMAGNLLGADPRPVAGYGGGLPELLAPPVAPAGVPASVLATEGRAFGGIKTPLRSVPAPGVPAINPLRPWEAPVNQNPEVSGLPMGPFQEAPRVPMAEAMGPVQPYRNKFYSGDTMPDLPVFMRDSHFQAWANQNPEQVQEYQAMKALGMTPRQYEDYMNQPRAPRTEPLQQRFIGSGGTETVNWAPDNTFLGGDYRGQAYKTQADRSAAVDAWNKLQGQRETGIAGTPSLESIMNNQLGGLPMTPEQKRIMAIGMQQQFSIPAAGLERERIQADEADKNRKAVFSAKQQEILGFHMNQFDEKNPFATQAERDTYRDKVARGIGAEIPKSLTAQGSVTNTATDPLSGVVLGARMGDLDSIFASEKGKSFVPTEASAASLMRVLADTPEASRKSVLDAAMMKAAAYPEFRKLLMQQMLQKYMTATGARFNRTGMTVGPDQTGLPFTVKTSPQPGYMGFIPGGFMAGPKVTIEPDGGGPIPFPWAEKPWESSRLLTDDIERRRMLDEIRATSPLLEALRNAR